MTRLAPAVLLALAACGAPPLPRPPEPPKAEMTLRRDVDFPLSQGWTRPEPHRLRSESLGAVARVIEGEALHGVESVVRQWCGIVRPQAGRCGDVALGAESGIVQAAYRFPDGTAGRVFARRLADGTVLLMSGEWPGEHDDRAAHDLNVMFRNATVR